MMCFRPFYLAYNMIYSFIITLNNTALLVALLYTLGEKQNGENSLCHFTKLSIMIVKFNSKYKAITNQLIFARFVSNLQEYIEVSQDHFAALHV